MVKPDHVLQLWKNYKGIPGDEHSLAQFVTCGYMSGYLINLNKACWEAFFPKNLAFVQLIQDSLVKVWWVWCTKYLNQHGYGIIIH